MPPANASRHLAPLRNDRKIDVCGHDIRQAPRRKPEAGTTKLTDKTHELDYGFSNQGRMRFANANYRF
ncbi:hypothetical protein AB6Q56_10845 [Dechloromonas sp. ARDL1]|uniref:hypothetical protein n=1 Tax=Dechloromonas sp. ARDL1 TaxID=3322121 RepID=UPI003DA756A8